MLTQITHWMQVAGTVADAILLARVLTLRLRNTYTFITLACALTLFFDLAELWFGIGGEVSGRIFIYTRFLYVFLFPLVAWDVFEEIKSRIGKVRRLAIGRLVSGMFFTLVLGLLMVAFADTDSAGGDTAVVATLAIILWAGSSTASLAFLVTMHRVLRTQPIELPNNTSVWMRFYEWSLAAEVASCFLLLLTQYIQSRLAGDIIDLVLTVYGIAITVWCVWRLRRISSENMGQAGEKAAL